MCPVESWSRAGETSGNGGNGELGAKLAWPRKRTNVKAENALGVALGNPRA
jgi:hypothetical protein